MVKEENPVELGTPVQPALGVFREEDELDPRKGVKKIIEPMEEVEEVCINDEDPMKVIKVGKNLPPVVREKILSTVKKNSDVLAWNHFDMTRISPHVIYHALNVDPKADPLS
uniref:Reverse transcriptase domain-containing protein n=1 Tax=Cannabis sativa TaxID=3483 RepID=A0A803QEJ5_CANSA